jgi:hypothetical protein
MWMPTSSMGALSSARWTLWNASSSWTAVTACRRTTYSRHSAHPQGPTVVGADGGKCGHGVEPVAAKLLNGDRGGA